MGEKVVDDKWDQKKKYIYDEYFFFGALLKLSQTERRCFTNKF